MKGSTHEGNVVLYYVEDTKDQQKYVLKSVLKSSVGSPKYLFYERDILKDNTHPNLNKLFNFCVI